MNKKILLVDDDKSTLDVLEKVLVKAGYETLTAQTGAEALNRIHFFRPHLVILDLVLPDIDGIEVYNEARRDPKLSNIFFIVLSARDEPDLIASLLTKGVNDYIVKKRGADKELLGKCASYFARRPQSDSNRGCVISFFSAKGGNGTSTLCLNLAHALGKLVAPKKMVVVDLVLPLGSIALMVGQTLGSTIAELTVKDQTFTRIALSSYLPFINNWGFSILAGSRSPREAQDVNPAGIEPLFETLREVFDFVVVDMGRTLSRISIPVVQQSISIVLILGPDLVTVEITKTALDYLEELGIAKKQIFPILNRAVGLEGLTKREIEKKLELPIQGTVPYAANNFTLATNQNLPYALRHPGDGTTFGLTDLAKRLKRQVEDITRY